jgi:Ran-binding protein 9/10
VAIGFADSELESDRLPGWDKNSISYGYHGNDGRKLANGERSVNYAAQYTAGDVVGCGINFYDGTVYFTKNGISLGMF